MINGDLVIKANELREQLGEDNKSPIDIFPLIENIDNLTVVYYPMGNNLSGMCIKGNTKNNVIAINSSMSLGRQKFSMAHELFHLYYDDNMVAICTKSLESGGTVEKNADTFASYFLMPPLGLSKKVKELQDKRNNTKLQLEDLICIEQYFGVSHQATVIRLKNEQILNQVEVDHFLHVAVKNTARRMGYNTTLYETLPEEKLYGTFGHYIKQATQAFENDLISSGKYEELLMTAFRPDLVYGDIEDGELID